MLLDDLLQSDLTLVFCGTALGTASYQAQAYYAHPGNRFYPTLHQVGLTPRQLRPKEYPKLTALGIGLTDINKTQYGSDSSLSSDCFDGDALRQKILRYQPRYLAFTSKRAAQEYLKVRTVKYGLTHESTNIGKTRLFVLPSPSGLATKYWDITHWRNLAELR